MNRRSFLKSGLILCAAPAIVKAENIMKVQPIITPRKVRVANAEFSVRAHDQYLDNIAKCFGIPRGFLESDVSLRSRLLAELKQSNCEVITPQYRYG